MAMLQKQIIRSSLSVLDIRSILLEVISDISRMEVG